MGARVVSSNKHVSCVACSGVRCLCPMWFGAASAVWTALISFSFSFSFLFFFQPKHVLLHDFSALKL